MTKGKLAAVIPVKMLNGGKSRLSAVLNLEERKDLILNILDHMLHILERSPHVARSFVASDDPVILSFLEESHPRAALLKDGGGLNETAAAAGRALRDAGFSSMLFLLGDLPLLGEGDIACAAELGEQYDVVILPDSRGEGSNGLLLTPPDGMDAHFGPGSFAAHAAQARGDGHSWTALEREGFAFDLDTPEDLALLKGKDCRIR